MRALIAELAYRGEVLCSRIQGIAYDSPSRNGEYSLLRSLADTITNAVDIGSNVGDWTGQLLSVTRNRPNVICVEPDPTNFEILRTRFKDCKNVQVIEGAVSDRLGTAAFVTGDDRGAGIGHVAREGTAVGNIEVRLLTLQTLVADNSDCQIDLVKCDVEGEEMAVLSGGAELFRKGRIAVMQVEYNVTWQRSNRTLRHLFEFASDYQYKLLLLTPMGCARLPSYGIGLEDYRLRNIILVRQDIVDRLAPFGPAGRVRVEHTRRGVL